MAVTLKADNRSLTTDAKYSYLSTNYVSGVSSFVLVNADGLAVDQYITIGNFGSETTEIARVASVTAATNTITLKTDAGAAYTTRFAHSESTKITVIPYNQVRFYWTATAVFAVTTPVAAQADLTASGWYSIVSDSTHSTGYGWYVFYNVANSTNSTNSAAIAYGGAAASAVSSVIKDFFSLLNNKELKLISTEEAYSWMNEAYTLIRNNLNMVNHEYFVSDVQTVAIVAGTQEYALPSDFSDIVVVWSGQQVATSISSPEIPFISLHDVNLYQGLEPKYYIRGTYLGFIPIPTGTELFYYRYIKEATRLTADSDTIDLPAGAAYAIKDFMLYRAYQKLSSPASVNSLKAFSDWINNMKIFAIKRDGADDSFGIAAKANV